MRLLLVALCLLFTGLYAFIGVFFTADVVFHEISDNETAATVITAVVVALLVAGTAYLARRARGRDVLVLLAMAVALLFVQVLAQEFVRSSIAERAQADRERIWAGLEISEVSDGLLLTPAGQAIGVRLSLTLETAHDGSFVLYPYLRLGTEGRFFLLTPVRYERRPPFGAEGRRYRKGQSYRLTYDMVLPDLGWDEAGANYCRRFVYVDADYFLEFRNSVLSDSGNPGRAVIRIDGARFEGTTAEVYDFAAFADTAMKADFPVCDKESAHRTID